MAASGAASNPGNNPVNPFIVGIYSEGYRAGKDSTARVLVREFGFTLYDFSTVLKEHVWENLTRQRWPIYEDWFAYCEAHKYDGPDEEGYWVRKLLQAWGQFYRSIDLTFWVNLWESRIRERGYPKVVVPSVRFANSEGKRIAELGGCFIKVNRPGIVVDEDPSENGMRGWIPDLVIENDGTLDDLATKAREVIRYLEHKGPLLIVREYNLGLVTP